MILVGALIPLDRSRPPPPLDALPIGRAARGLLDDGIAVALGDEAVGGALIGWIATREGWAPARDLRVVGAYDRYPAPRDPARHAALLAGLAGVPVGNPGSLRALSRDKLLSQQHLVARGVRMPEVEGEPERLDAALRRWGAAYAKPRFGAGGHGVQRLVAGQPVPREAVGAHGALEPVIAQAAVPPPAGWAGISVRTLVQRDPGGAWVATTPVARRSRVDPVVNVHRGAEADPADDVLPAATVAALRADAVAAAAALADHPDGALLLELGVDAAVDADGVPWVIEVNTRPWGRLGALAARYPARFAQEEADIAARPFRFLAARARGD